MQTPVIDLAQTVAISVGSSRHCTNWVPKHITWQQLCERMRTPKRTPETAAEYAGMTRDQRAEIKDVGGFVGGVVEGGSRKTGSVQGRQLIALDADYGTPTLWDDWTLMVGCAALMHSTHSHTHDAPRLRLLIPLSRPVTALEYEPIARRLAEWTGIEAFDDTTYEPARLMYWPSCPKDGEYIFESCDGAWVNPDEILATYDDWHDIRQWPISSRQQRVIRKMGEKQGDPLAKPGIVGAFNRAYSITDAIVKFLPTVYSPCGGDRWTFNAGSTTGGAVTYDDDTFLFSHHDTDPTSGRLCNAFDLVRIHLFGSQDNGAPDDALVDLPSTHAMRKLCADDDAVRAELADSIRSSAEDVFDELDSLERYTDDLTEQGTAVAFVDQFGMNVRHCGAFGWMLWDGQKWLLDAEAEVYMLVMQFSDDLYGRARVAVQSAEDKAAKQRAEAELKHAIRLRTSSGQKSLLSQVAQIVHEPAPESYDADPFILNTPDGIVDLKTGVLRPHDRSARCTKITNASLCEGDAERWKSFTDHITGGDVDLAEYLQVLSGMAAIGEVYEEGLVISYGPGGNGKSTLFNGIRSVLGDYARGVNADVLVGSNGHTDQSFVMALRGSRLVIMGETEEGAHFGVAQMKRLTSKDRISARALYKDPVEFLPTHTTIMHTNHLPKLSSLDGGTKRRIAVAPFPATLPPEQVITNYESLLVRECSGVILRWIVDGAVKFYKAGCKLAKPKCVVQATERYIASQDWLAAYLEDRCEMRDGYTVGATELMIDYKAWAERQGEYVRKRNDLQSAMEARGFEKEKLRSSRWIWRGLRFREEEV